MMDSIGRCHEVGAGETWEVQHPGFSSFLAWRMQSAATFQLVRRGLSFAEMKMAVKAMRAETAVRVRARESLPDWTER